MSREAMQIALDALEANLANWAEKTKAVKALRQALETEPEALRLADALDDEFTQGRISNHNGRKAATELRRLHEVNQDLLKALKDLLDEAEWLRREYSHDRERDGWDALEEDPCFTVARAAIAKATGEKS